MILIKKENYPALINNPQGEIIQEVIGVQAGRVTSHSIAKITLPPGGTAVPHFHQITEETYYILSGQGTLRFHEKTIELQAGDCVLIEPGEIHQIKNNWHENLVFMAVCVPAWQAEDSFDVLTDNQ